METIKPTSETPNGTSLQAEICADYRTLVALFGRQNATTDGYKVDAEWLLETPLGLVTIYNYKDGKNYNGRRGLAIKNIRDWHIGAYTKNAALIVSAVIEAYELAKAA